VGDLVDAWEQGTIAAIGRPTSDGRELVVVGRDATGGIMTFHMPDAAEVRHALELIRAAFE
jgi:hypothetical protein